MRICNMYKAVFLSVFLFPVLSCKEPVSGPFTVKNTTADDVWLKAVRDGAEDIISVPAGQRIALGDYYTPKLTAVKDKTEKDITDNRFVFERAGFDFKIKKAAAYNCSIACANDAVIGQKAILREKSGKLGAYSDEYVVLNKDSVPQILYTDSPDFIIMVDDGIVMDAKAEINWNADPVQIIIR